MATFERQLNHDDIVGEVLNGIYFGGQQFTVGRTGNNVDHTLSSIDIWAKRTGSPGTIDVELSAVDESGFPTGTALSTGSTNGNTITTSIGGEKVSIEMSSYVLRQSTRYAIVIKVESGDIKNYIEIYGKEGGGAYPNDDSIWIDQDPPNNWYNDVSSDIYFAEIGTQYYEETEEGETVPSVSPSPRDVYISGFDTRFQKRQAVGYFSTSGDLRSMEVNASGHVVIVEAGLPKIRTGEPVALTSASGGQSICVSGQWCSGTVHVITVKSLSGEIFIGDSGCRPYIGYGYSLANREEIKLDVCDPRIVYGVAVASGDLAGYIGTDYIN